MKSKTDKTENRRGPGRPPEEPGKVQSVIVHVRLTEAMHTVLKRAAGGKSRIPAFLRTLIRERLGLNEPPDTAHA